MASILVTGFEPFLKEIVNPSGEILRSLPVSPEVETLILPVSYERSWRALQSHLENRSYEFILMLGQAGGRAQISLEKVALNLQDSATADEDGMLRLDQKISVEGPKAIISSLPLREWASLLLSKQRPVNVSHSAGAFVCNSLYYQLSEKFFDSEQTRVLFVHVPYLSEQVQEKENSIPSLTLDVMTQAIQNLIELCRL